MENFWTYVYIAGPMRLMMEKGVHDACKMADRLYANGFIPFIPQLSFLWSVVTPFGSDDEIYAARLPYDFAWVDKCDALIRLPGQSRGADAECVHADLTHKPVFTEFEKLVAWRDETFPQRRRTPLG